MIYCPSCGTANRHGSRYCNECGVKFSPQMEVQCPRCGELNAIDNLLCHACGQRLSSPQPPTLPEETGPEETEAYAPGEAEEKAEIPGWLRDLPPAAGEEAPPAGEEQGLAALDGSPPPAALPRARLPEAEGQDLAEVPLAGRGAAPEGGEGRVPGELPVAVPSASPQRSEQRAPGAALESPAARLFSEIVTPAPRKASTPAPRRKAPLLAQLPRWLLYAALIAAVTWPLVVQNPWSWVSRLAPGVTFRAPRSMTASPAMQDLYRQIGSLDAGAPVLIAFDYDPASAGEMDVVAGEILEHLLDREARLVTISLVPAGPPTAQRLLETTMAGRPAYATGYGQRYANLGYLPGKEAAVRLLGRRLATVLPVDFFGHRLADLAVMDRIITLQSFDLIVVFTSGQDTLRWWIEQTGAPYQVKLAAGVSASLEPLARPYYETSPRQLAGLIGGVPGAAMYASLRRNTPPADAAGEDGAGAAALPLEQGMSARLDAQLAGHAVLILVLLGGNILRPVLAALRRAMRRER